MTSRGSQPKHATRRGYVNRMALFYGFWTLLSGSLVILAVVEMFLDDIGYIIMFGVFTPVFILVGYQARHYIMDRNAEVVVSEGEIMKKWDKGNPLEIPMLIFIVGLPLAIFKLATDAELEVAVVLGYLLVSGVIAWKFVLPLIRDTIALANSGGNGIVKVAGGTLGFFFLPSFYMVVDSKIFTVASEDFLHLLETDLVRIHHFPNSLTIEQMERYDPVTKSYVRPDADY